MPDLSRFSRRCLKVAATALVLAAAGTAASADSIGNPYPTSVPGAGDLYLAGLPSGASCCNNDSSPAEAPALATINLVGGEILTFSATGGASYEPGPTFATPDGQTAFTYNMTADYGTGISGAKDIYLAGWAGVFLGPPGPTGFRDPPYGPAPAQLSGTSFATLSPGLDQIFSSVTGLPKRGPVPFNSSLYPRGRMLFFWGLRMMAAIMTIAAI
jgi:hypothetical protein